MKILISGCSFTHWPEEPGSDRNICWPSYLKDHWPDVAVKNLAEPGAGNLYIANSVIQEVTNNPNDYGLVLIMWSGMTRIDFLTDLTNQAWNSLFESYGFYRRMEHFGDKLGYIFSGGQIGIWMNHPATDSLFRSIYKISNNISLAYNNLIEIVKTQEFLASKQIPYRFMSYVNYWNDLPHVSPNGDFGIVGKPELANLVRAIDFSKWIFADDDKNCIYELAKQKNDFHGDKFHPGIQTHREWAKLIVDSL